MSIIRIGASKQFSDNFDTAFGKKRTKKSAAKKSSATKKSSRAKKK